jgi:adenylate cyclase
MSEDQEEVPLMEPQRRSLFHTTMVRYGLIFDDPADEQVFADRFLRDFVGLAQVFLVVGALFYYVFFLWDAIIDPVNSPKTHLIRGVIVAPAMCVCAALLFTTWGKRHVEGLILASCGMGQLALAFIYIILENGYNYAAVGFVLMFMGTTAAFPIRARYLVGASVFALLATIVGHLYANNAQPGWLVINVLAISCAISFGSLSAYFRERAAREQFRTEKDLAGSRARVDQLLHSILPKDVVQRIQAGEHQIADSLGEVSIVFADMAGFTDLARRLSPTDLIRILSAIFSALDRQAEHFGIDRIKTIGDAYMAVGGLKRSENGRDHAIDTADFLLSARETVRRIILDSGYPLDIRIGFHVGPVVAGVIGRRRPAFDCWGESVNLASRLESKAPKGEILVSESAYWRLKDHYDLDEVSELDLKGIGFTRAFILRGRKDVSELRRAPDPQELTLPPALH